MNNVNLNESQLVELEQLIGRAHGVACRRAERLEGNPEEHDNFLREKTRAEVFHAIFYAMSGRTADLRGYCE